MTHLKLTVVGPSEVMKYDAVEQVTGEYRPTKGVRILEFEQDSSYKGKSYKVEVELWDTSGSKSYESCWPTIFRGLNGVVFVYNPTNKEHGKALDEWHTTLAQYQALKDSQCCVIGYFKTSKSDRDVVNLPSSFSQFSQIKGNVSEEGEKFREEFLKFISSVLSNRIEATEQEELNIINS